MSRPHTRKRLLIVENDTALSATLQRLFQREGYTIYAAPSVEIAFKQLAKHDCDLVIIDRVLDDGDGLEILKYLKEVSPGVRSICLTTKGEVTERIKGLFAGADDYLPKPFATQELLLRVKRLLQMQKMVSLKEITHEQFKLNPENGVLVLRDSQIHLRRRENQILQCLLQHKGQVVTREKLYQTIWPNYDHSPQLSSLDVYVRRLRLQLKSDAQAIKTIRGYGYMLRA